MESDESEEEEAPREQKSKKKKKPEKSPPKEKPNKNIPIDDGVAGDREDSSEGDDDADDFDHYNNKQGAAGMANAMAKILGTTSQKATTVLSKTTTPLQRQLHQEKEAARKKQKVDKQPLPALHIPLSVATSLTITTSGQSVAQELEQERLHRRVATRGVVALFNAVAQHQQEQKRKQEETVYDKNTAKDVKKLTKHGFLDMIKNTAAANAKVEKGKSDNPKGKWAATQDDFLLNPKKVSDVGDECGFFKMSRAGWSHLVACTVELGRRRRSIRQ